MSKDSKKEVKCINDLIERMRKESSESTIGYNASLEAGLKYVEMNLDGIHSSDRGSLDLIRGFFHALYAVGYIAETECNKLCDEAWLICSNGKGNIMYKLRGIVKR